MKVLTNTHMFFLAKHFRNEVFCRDITLTGLININVEKKVKTFF